jgi:hypothetical protein
MYDIDRIVRWSTSACNTPAESWETILESLLVLPNEWKQQNKQVMEEQRMRPNTGLNKYMTVAVSRIHSENA